MGTFDPHSATYTDKNTAHIEHTLAVIQEMVDMYADEPVVMGIEPVNEPVSVLDMHTRDMDV